MMLWDESRGDNGLACCPLNNRSAGGAQGRNRTTDTAIFNRMLYQLSYLGAESWYKSSRKPAQSKPASRAPRVIKARFRTVQNSAKPPQKS